MAEKNPAAVALGSLGGKARGNNQTQDERRKQARHAAQVRWEKEKKKKRP